MPRHDLTCDLAREFISADADGETTSEEQQMLSAHVDACHDCAFFAARVGVLERRLRIRVAEPVPDLVAAVMVDAHPAVLGRGGWMRPALVWVSIVLFLQNSSALFLGRLEGAETHLARHLGAFGVAMAVGFAYVAWRPHRAFGLLPFAVALGATTFASAAFDLMDGGRTALAESVHLTELAGLVLVWMIAGSPGWRGQRARRRRTAAVGRLRT